MKALRAEEMGRNAPPATRNAASAATLLALALILVAATLTRVRELRASLYGDEAYHVVVAESLLDGHGPQLADGFIYSRALPFSRAVAISMHWLGRSEWAARLPAFLAGMACVVLIFLVGLKWFGPAVGLIAATIAALEPQSVYYSTFVRFYSTAQFCVLLGAYSFERAIARAYPDDAVLARPVRDWIMGAALWGLVLALCLGLALSLQVLSGCLVLGILVFALVRFAWVGVKRGLGDALRAPEAFVVYAIVAASLAVAVVAPGLARYAWSAVTKVEVWNRREGLAPLYYVYALRQHFPLEWFLLPLGVLAALRKNPRAGLLASCTLVSTLAVQSLLPQKSPQYILLVMPFFFMLSATGMVSLLELVGQNLAAGWPALIRRAAAVIFVLFALRSSPWFLRDPRNFPGTSWIDWRAAVTAIRSEIAPEDFIVAGMGDDMFAVRYYTGRVDAHMATRAWTEERTQYRPTPPKAGDGPYNIPCLSRADEVVAALDRHPRAWVIYRTSSMDPTSHITPLDEVRKLAALGRVRTFDGGRVTVIEIVRTPAS